MKNKKGWAVIAVLTLIAAAMFLGSANSQDPAYSGQGWTQGTGEMVIVMNPQVGDVNKDGNITSADVVAMRLIRRFIYAGDVNGDNKLSEADETYLTNYILYGGPAPKPRTRCRSVMVKAYCDIEGEPLSEK